MTIRRVLLPVLGLLIAAGCVRRSGSNTDCIWPGEVGATMLTPDQNGYSRHLSADAEFAEELADRYGLKNAHGARQSFELARAQCIEAMFSGVARMHGVATAEVSAHLGTNRDLTDVALNMPFVLLYALASVAMATRIWSRADGMLVGTVLLLLCSIAFGAIGVLLGEEWSMIMECLRIGTGHLGVRASRLPWVRHRSMLSACLIIVFWAAAAVERFQTRRLGVPQRSARSHNLSIRKP